MKLLRNTLLTLIISTAAIAVLILTVYDAEFTTQHVLDAGFIIGIIVFFAGVIIESRMLKVFRGFGFLVRRLLYNRYHGISYFEYYQEQEEKARKRKKPGMHYLLAGLLIVIAVTVYAYALF